MYSEPRTSQCTPTAMRLPIVPLGTNTAASFPKISAMRRSNASTVGSSPKTSSPTSASAIALRMRAVGFVTVSDRRSTTRTSAGETPPTEGPTAAVLAPTAAVLALAAATSVAAAEAAAVAKGASTGGREGDASASPRRRFTPRARGDGGSRRGGGGDGGGVRGGGGGGGGGDFRGFLSLDRVEEIAVALFDVFRQRALARSPVILEDAALLDPREFRRLRGGETLGVAHPTHHELSAVALPPVEDVHSTCPAPRGNKCPYQRGAVAREVHEVRAEERIYRGLRGIRARHVSSRVRRCRDAALVPRRTW